MLRDRESTYNATYNSADFVGALAHEFDNGVQTVHAAAEGAKRFADGRGRGGSFKDV